jgi:uncharacterized protein YkwD
MNVLTPSASLRKRALLFAVAALAASLVALSTAPRADARPSACDSASAMPSKSAKRTIVRATLCLVNAQRARVGLGKLRLSRTLSKAARRHVRDMARRNYFDHNSLSGASFVDRIRRAGYLRRARSWAVGENLAWGSGSRGTPGSIVRAWMDSPGHRANILSGKFRHIGVGVAYDAPVNGGSGSPAGTYATEFGARG